MTATRQRFCRKCGDPVRSPDDRFCGVCGAPYEGEVEVPAEGELPPSAPPAPLVDAQAPTELDVDAQRPTRKVPVAEMELAAEVAAWETKASGREPSQPVPLVRPRPSASSVPIVGMPMDALRKSPPSRGGPKPATDARGTTSAWDVAEISIDEPLVLPGRRWPGCLLKTLLVGVLVLGVTGAAVWFLLPDESRRILREIGVMAPSGQSGSP